jgi:putative salt-induced outer membrane protein YdiY
VRRFCLLFAIISLYVSAALGDQVLLKNGDRISGQVVRLDNNNLLVKSEALGDVKIKWDAVALVSADVPVHVIADGARVEADVVRRNQNDDTIFTSNESSFSVTPGRIVALRSDAEQVAYQQQLAREQHPEFLDRWNGALDAGLSAARGNADTTNISLGMHGARTTNRTRLSIAFSSLLARNRAADGTTLTSANAFRSGLRYEINVSDRIFTFGFGNFESDRVQHLNLRDVIGGGAGLRVSQSQRGTLDVFTGASVNQESFSVASGTPDRRTGELLFGQDASYNLSSRTSFGGRLSLFPNLTTPGDYRAVVDTTATTKLNSWLGWQVTMSNIYVSNPAGGARTNDLLLSTGLRFNIGQERPFKPHTTEVKFKPQAGY